MHVVQAATVGAHCATLPIGVGPSNVARGTDSVTMLGVRKEAARRTLYTIGHSTRSAHELIDILTAFGVVHVVDIRSIPRSRTNPQFDSKLFRVTLRRAGIAYTLLKALGGRRPKSKLIDESVNAGWKLQSFHNYADYVETAAFQEGLGTLLDLVASETCVIMCAEVVWWRCHRRIVADQVLAQGVPVVHLFDATRSEPASLTPFAVIEAHAHVSYPASALFRSSSSARADGIDVAFSGAMKRPARMTFQVGDHVSWNSEAGRVRGIIKKVLTTPTKLKGYVARATKQEPQYLIESDKTDHIAVHKGSALRKLRSVVPKRDSNREISKDRRPQR